MPQIAAPSPPRTLAKDLASLAVCGLIWGSTWRVIKLQIGVVPVAESVVYRFALASVLLFALCAVTGRSVALTRRQHLAALAHGAAGFGLQYALVYLAERTVASGVVAVIFAAAAFANLALFRIAQGQRAPPLAWTGALLGLAGVAVMSMSELSGPASPQGGAIGVALALCGVIASVFGNLFAARVQSAGVAIGPGTAWAMGYGAALLALAVLVTGQPWRFELSARYVASLIYLAVLGSVTAFLVFYALARRRGYSFAAYVAALTPPAAMALSSLTESVRWGAGALAGLALVLAGQALLIRGSRK